MDLTRFHKLKNLAKSEHVRVLVSGFGLQQLVPVCDVIEGITSLPTDHVKRLKVIKYDPDKNIPFLLRHQRVGPQLGEYLGSFDSIVIYGFRCRSECFHVLFHEIGHHVYFRVISSQMKKKWVTQVYRSEPGVTELGSRNACEDFAETYALYINQPDKLKAFPVKFNFISELFC